MKKSLLYKTISVVLVSAFILLLAGTVSMAQSSFLTTPTPQDSSLIKPTQNIAGAILSVVQVIGVSVAIIMLIVLAIKYMSAAPNDKAEIKKHAVVYVVGAVVLFAASGILQIIKGFATSLDTTGGGAQTGGQSTSQGGITPGPGMPSMAFD